MHVRHELWLVLGLAALAGGAPERAAAQALRQSLVPEVGLDTLQTDGLGTASPAAADGTSDVATTGSVTGVRTGVTPVIGDATATAAPATATPGTPTSPQEADAAQAQALEATPAPTPEEEDPYAPLGIRLGSFVLHPSIDVLAGRSSNIDALPQNGDAGTYYKLGSDLELKSDWGRHELTGRFSSDTEFDEGDTNTSIDSELALRLDLVRGLVADLGATYHIAPEALSDPNLPATAVERPDAQSYGATAGLSDDVGRIGLSGRAAYTAYRYEDARLSDGSIYDNSDRNYDERALTLRASYELQQTVSGFVEGGVNDRVYERSIDDNGVRRGSKGYNVLAGVSIARDDVLQGEVGIGYQNQTPDDPTLPDVSGLMYRGSLAWRPTPLTTVRLEGSLRPQETTLEPGASGIRDATLDLSVEHALRRNLVVTARLAADRSEYVGIDRLDTTYTASLDVDYKVNRWLSWRAAVSHARHDSNADGSDYTDTRVEAGVTVRR